MLIANIPQNAYSGPLMVSTYPNNVFSPPVKYPNNVFSPPVKYSKDVKTIEKFDKNGKLISREVITVEKQEYDYQYNYHYEYLTENDNTGNPVKNEFRTTSI